MSDTPSFESILFDREVDGQEFLSEPAFFGDLHLDQIVASLTAGREEYELRPLFYRALYDVEAVSYRHHVLRDLEQEPVLEVVREFARGMHRMRECMKVMRKLSYDRQKQRWFVDGIDVYCTAVTSLVKRLGELELRSAGFVALRNYVSDYIESPRFTSLVADTQRQQAGLAAITYALHIRGNRIRVSKAQDEPNMTTEIERTFAKFKRDGAHDYRARFREDVQMNHIEAKILDLVAKLYPHTFADLDACCQRQQDYVDETIGRFDREIQFYLAYLDYIGPLKASGLAFTYPRVSARTKEEHADQVFDLALARKLLDERATVVCNDFHLTSPERIVVVSGPNNGGKTTFARMFGQLHYLASLGLSVPASDARLFLPDQIFTHFEREEDIETLRGKFEDELFRIHQIVEQATDRSVLIMNEAFGSTTLRDALVVGTEVMKQIIELDTVCVFVTFVDELASMGDSTVSMMSTVVPDDPAVRTYKVVRKPADGLAYAAAIAEKYGLTYAALRTRLAK